MRKGQTPSLEQSRALPKFVYRHCGFRKGYRAKRQIGDVLAAGRLRVGLTVCSDLKGKTWLEHLVLVVVIGRTTCSDGGLPVTGALSQSQHSAPTPTRRPSLEISKSVPYLSKDDHCEGGSKDFSVSGVSVFLRTFACHGRGSICGRNTLCQSYHLECFGKDQEADWTIATVLLP